MSDLATRLRTACDQVRVKSYPLSDLIPLMQQAADALAAAPAQPAPSAPQPSPTPQADSQPALPKITAEDRSFLHDNPNTDDIVKWVQDYARAAISADRAARAPADSVTAPAGGVDDDVNAVALARYKVVPAHESMFHRFAVVAGDGKQQLYIGREAECQNMARKFAGAFLDGAFYQALAAAPQPSPPPAPAQPGQEGERDYPFLPRSVGDVEDWADGKARGVSWSDAPPPGGTSLYTAGHMRAYVDADRAARAQADSVLEDAARWKFVEANLTYAEFRDGSYFSTYQWPKDESQQAACATVDAARKQGANHD